MADGGSWKAEIRKGRSRRRFDQERYPGFAYRRDGKYAYHWERSGLSSSEVGAFKAAARADGFKLVAWEEAYERSTTYRKAFLAANPGPWRCRYCNRRIDRAERMTVDHIVPVAAVKDPFAPRRALARWVLGKEGAATVNDGRNLAASCARCNSRKGQKMGLWTIRGWLGSRGWYWPALRGAQCAVAAAAVWLVAAGPASPFAARFARALANAFAGWM